MPNEATRAVDVSFTSEFKRNVRRLSKKYRHIRTDVQPVIEQLERGELPGDRVKGTGHVVLKVRIANSDARKGKSGGYRLIYHHRSREKITLVTIYSKSDQGDISAKAIREVLTEFES